MTMRIGVTQEDDEEGRESGVLDKAPRDLLMDIDEALEHDESMQLTRAWSSSREYRTSLLPARPTQHKWLLRIALVLFVFLTGVALVGVLSLFG